MTQVECDLSFYLVKKYYGRIVADVARHLCKNRNQVLGQIIVATKLKPSLVRKALCVLVKHKLVLYKSIEKRTEYLLSVDDVLQMLLYPKMIYTMKSLYGSPGEFILQEVLVHGMAEKDAIIDAVVRRLVESGFKYDYTTVSKFFQDLADARFLVSEPIISEKKPEDKKDENNGGFTTDRKRKISSDLENIKPDMKRTKVLDVYSANINRYKQYFRDEAITLGITNKFGLACGEIVRAILRISEVTTSPHAERTHPISSNEIRQSLPMNMNIPILHVEQYLNIMINDESNMIQKFDESSSGMYVINLKKSIRALCVESVLSYVQERYGSKCSRIFKLLMLKNHLEQKQVEDFAMIPSKEAKELLYQMWSEHILVMQEIPKTVDHAPSRTYFLFNVNIEKAVRTILNRTHKTLVNLLVRQQHEMKSNKRVIEKQERIQLIKANIQEEDEGQLEEIEGMLTTAERDLLQKFEHCSGKLVKAQFQVMNTAFLFNLYLSQ